MTTMAFGFSFDNASLAASGQSSASFFAS